MTPEQYRRIREVFLEAVELPSEERREFLLSALGGDEGLVREAEALVRAEKGGGDFLKGSAIVQAARDFAVERLNGMLGREVGRYRLEKVLGAGGGGEVYLAADLRLNRKVALKFLSESHLTDRRILMRFEQEAQAASALSHPNVCHIYSLGEADGQRFVAMEYVEGETLRQRLASAGVTAAEALDIAIQIASALTAAHAAGIVHRDIKPDNVMLRPDGLVKVLDFGISKRLPAYPDGLETVDGRRPVATSPGEILGTVDYMSPEQARGTEVDAGTDIWAFGCVLYEMMTGCPPFAREHGVDVLAAIVSAEPPPMTRFRTDVPRRLEALVGRALRKKRSERWPTVDEMLAELRAVRRSLATAGSRITATDRTVPYPAAEPAIAAWRGRIGSFGRRALAVPLVLAALILLGSVLFRGSNERVGAPPVAFVPFTSLPGRELHPSFSPDGSRIAFAQDEEDRDNLDIYVKPTGGGVPLRLTSDPRREFSPVFSPDGRRIAFYRVEGGRGEVVLIPASGGPERVLARTPEMWRPAVDPRPGEPIAAGGEQRVLSWIDGGEQLAVIGRESPEEPAAVYRMSVATGVMERITNPPSGSFGEIGVAVSPDGAYLAFTRSEASQWVVSRLFWVPLERGQAGEPQRIDSGGADVLGFAWEPAGGRLLFTTSEGLYRVTIPGGSPELIPIPGYTFAQPAVSPDGRQVAFVQASWDLDIWQVPALNSPSSENPEPRRLIASTRFDTNPVYSPDGRRIAFSSARSGSMQVWVSAADGTRPLQITTFKEGTGTPRWSPDGLLLAFDSVESGTGDIYVVPAEGGVARNLGLEGSHEQRPSWSRDGRWIYFESDRTGDFRLWKMPVAGGEPVQVTSDWGADASESPDGRYVYYTKFRRQGIWRRPVGGGIEEPVLARGRPNLWAVFNEGLCLLDEEATTGPVIDCLTFGAGSHSPVVQLPRGTRINRSGPSFSVSPDGQSFLYVVRDREESDILLAENFN